MFSLALLLVSCGAALAQLWPVPVASVPEYPVPNPFVPETNRNTNNVGNGPFRPERRGDEREARPVDDLDLVILNVVSGERNPDVPIREDTNTPTDDIPGQLNIVGKREALALGRALRERYGDLIHNTYDPNNFVAQSSTGESEQMTGQVINAGLFPPVGSAIFDPRIQWQPVPLVTTDTVLGVGRISECPTVREVIRPIFTGEVPAVRNVLRREKRIVDYVIENTGIRGNIEELAQVAENLRQMRVQNRPLPEWVERPRMRGMEREELFRRIQLFRNAVEVACSVYEPCRKVVVGVLLNNLVEVVRNVGRNPPEPTVNTVDNTVVPIETRVTRGMIVNTGDVEVILSILRVLRIEPYNVFPTEGLIMEVRSNPSPSVRMVITRPDDNNPEVRRFLIPRHNRGHTREQDCPEDFCPVEDFVRRVREEIREDYRGPCPRDCSTTGTTETTGVTVQDYREVDIFANPKYAPKGIDCTSVRDKYPESACRELARNHLCVRNNAIRNVFCLRTCHCTQYEVLN